MMILDSEIIDHLVELGLTLNEAKILYVLSVLEISDAKLLIQYSKVPRSKIYSITSSLQEKGLLHKQTIKGTSTKFKSLGIETILETLENNIQQKMSSLDFLKKELAQIKLKREKLDFEDDVQDIWTVQGINNLKPFLTDFFVDITNVFFRIRDSQVLKLILPNLKYLKNDNKIVNALVLKNEEISYFMTDNIENLGEYFSEIAWIDTNSIGPASNPILSIIMNSPNFIITDFGTKESKSIIIIPSEDNKDFSSLIISNKHFASFQGSIINVVWNLLANYRTTY